MQGSNPGARPPGGSYPRARSDKESILAVTRAAYRGELPRRYDDYPASFHAPFHATVATYVAADQHVLDVGGGRTPTLEPSQRGPGTHYVGMDVLRSELEAAPPGGYDEMVVGDITRHQPELSGRFDLIVSFQVLEHVEGIDRAFANMVDYLRPGGHLVAQMSGSYASYSVIARLVPHWAARRVQRRLYGREPDTVFRPRYDRCHFSALQRTIAGASHVDIVPLWIAAPYFRFSRTLQSAYVAYEEWARRRDHLDLAPYYLVTVRR